MKSGDKIKKKQILLYDDSEEFIEIVYKHNCFFTY